MKIQSISKIFVLVISVIGLILWFLMNSNISEVMAESGSLETKDLVSKPFENPDTFEAATSAVTPIYGLLIFVGAIILIATILTVVNGMMKNSGSLKGVLIGIGFFIAVLLIAYLLTGGDTTEYIYQDRLATEGESHMAGAGIVAFYFLLSIAVGSMLVFGVKKMFK